MGTSRIERRRDGVTTTVDLPDPVIATTPAIDIEDAQKWTFNFAAAGNAKIYAHEAMTIASISSVGAGALTYKKSTAAAPSTFGSTISLPTTLEAGAWLEITAAGAVAVHLQQTA